MTADARYFPCWHLATCLKLQSNAQFVAALLGLSETRKFQEVHQGCFYQHQALGQLSKCPKYFKTHLRMAQGGARGDLQTDAG